MSDRRSTMNRLGLRENILGCELHATVLPYLACIASSANSPFAARAMSHLQSIADGLAIDPSQITQTTRALRDEQGDELEPFGCPAELCRPLAIASQILARYSKSTANSARPVLCERLLVMNHGVRAAYSGIEVDHSSCRRFRCRDFRVRAMQTATSLIPSVPLAFDLSIVATSTVNPISARIDRRTTESALVLEFPNRHIGRAEGGTEAVLQFGGGFTTYIGDRQSDRLGGPSADLPPIQGKVTSHLLPGQLIATFPMNPSTMLRAAAMRGAKRFLARGLPRSAGSRSVVDRALHAAPYLIAGSIDSSGVRAACLNAEGWAVPSNDWMPFVPFCKDTNTGSEQPRAGSFESLIDLLLDLASEPTSDALARSGPSSSRRTRSARNTSARNTSATNTSATNTSATTDSTP